MHSVIDFARMITMAAASQLLPGNPHPVTVRRWSNQGLHGIRLQTWKVGRRRFTTRDAIEAFVSAITSQTDPGASKARQKSCENKGAKR